MADGAVARERSAELPRMTDGTTSFINGKLPEARSKCKPASPRELLMRVHSTSASGEGAMGTFGTKMWLVVLMLLHSGTPTRKKT